MRRTILLLLSSMAVGAGQVVITSTEATSKEVVVRYLAPHNYETTNPCTVQASYTNDFSAGYVPLADVDPAQFPGSDADTARNPKPFVGRSRTVVIGKQIPYWRTLPASATTHYRESLAVKAAATVYVKITCGTFSDTVSVSTKTVPFGLTFGEATPGDPNAPGFPNWPSVKWGSTQSIIDAEYGTELKRPDAAGSRGVGQTTGTPQEAFGADWTNANNILADDSNSATISASQSPLVIPWPYASLPIGSVSQAPGDTSGLDWIQLILKGAGAAGTADDHAVQACLSINSGASCYTPWHDILLGASQGTVTYPASPVPVDHWQAPGDRPIPRQWLAQRSGTFTYVAATSTVTITSGDHVAEKWVAGTKFRVSGATSSQITNITAGTPLVVETLNPHGLATGDSVVITNANGTIAAAANGTWSVTITDPTHFSLNGSTGSGTFGRKVEVWGGTAGSPARVYAPNSFFADQSLLLGSGFTDSGWTSLNGAILVARQYNGSSEEFSLTGSTTSGAFTQGHPGAYITQLAGTVQKVTDYAIASIVDATHVTLTSGPDADITTPAAWTVNPVAIMIRKKTTSSDTVSLQFAQVKIQNSPGTSWAAQGGEICAPNDADDGTGKLGSLCLIGSTSMWIPRDGSAARPWGSVPMPNSGDLNNLGISIIGNTDQGVIGINPHDPRRIYSGRKVRTSTGGSGQGYDNRIIVAEYEGDFQPRSSTENNASIKAQYPAYGNNQIEYPWLPNCYGEGKENDGTNPRVIPPGPTARCVSYRTIVPSAQALIAAYPDTRWQKMVSQIDHMPCMGGAGRGANFSYRPSTDSVWVTFSCTPYADQGGIVYVLDLGNEKPITDSGSTVAVKAVIDTWSMPGGRWSKAHGGLGHHDGYVIQSPHPSGMNSGTYSFDFNQTCVLCGAWWSDYLSVDGVAGAWLTKKVNSCAAWAGNPLLPSPVPDGTGGKGCNTVVVAGEPCDSSPDPEEVAIMATDPTPHLAKCGAPGRYWLQDAAVGDIVVIMHDANMDFRYIEPAVILAKTGTTWVLGRGWISRIDNGSAQGPGTIDHTGDTKRLIMTYSYDTGTGGTPAYYRPYDPVGPVLVQKLSLGHGAAGDTLTAGSNGNAYGVITGSVQRRLAATSFDFTIASRGLPFEGKRANDVVSTDSHMTFVESASLKNKDPWVVDCAPWNGYDGIPPTGPVAGTATVYKWTGPQLNGSIYTNQFPKFLAPEVRIGVWVARNISGPGSVIDDAQPYTFCEAYVAGECRSGSAAGDVYVAAPLVDQLAGKYQCCGNDFTALRDINISSVNSAFSRCTETILRNDATGTTGRALTTSLHTPRAEDSFKNMSVTNTGLIGVLRERGTEFVKSELFTLSMPPIVFDNIDRTHFWQQKIPIRPYFGADNVLVRFGYEHYGDVTAGQYYCTTRKENCLVGTATSSANPFFFEKSDTYGGISCTSGCSATLPVIPNRVAYYEVVFRSGNTVLYTMPQQVVVSP